METQGLLEGSSYISNCPQSPEHSYLTYMLILLLSVQCVHKSHKEVGEIIIFLSFTLVILAFLLEETYIPYVTDCFTSELCKAQFTLFHFFKMQKCFFLRSFF